MSAGTDSRFMRLALALGARGAGRVWPNPAVGCVIVREGRILGRGWTQPGGRPHAEVHALAQAGAAAAGATAYVTLEPCAHHGHTPPCADALVRAGVARVVTALGDPDPRVAGAGHARLREAGIAVEERVEAEAARRAHQGFLTRLALGRPMVTLKLATSLDGRIATASGESRWITGPGARHFVHARRLDHDAVLIGAGTARADDPMLDVRGFGAVTQPVRVVAARGLDLPTGGRLARSAGAQPLWLIHDPAATPPGRAEQWARLGARLFAAVSAGGDDGAAGDGAAGDGAGAQGDSAAAGMGGGLDPGAMLSVLGAAGLTRVLCEGGGALAAALLRADLVDRLLLCQAGVVLGREARAAVGEMAIARLAAAPRFTLEGSAEVGGDTVQNWWRDRAIG